MAVFNVNASPFDLATVVDGAGENFVLVDTSFLAWLANGILFLPGVPQAGVRIHIKDVAGQADIKPISVNGGGHLIDGQTSRLIQIPFESLLVTYDGSKWVVI